MPTLVFDNAPLSAFARARELPLLELLTAGNDRVTTAEVVLELESGLRDHPELREVLELPWLRVERLTEEVEIVLFAEYARRLGSGAHDVGEASVLAWAEAHGAIAFTDDEAAVQIGKERRVPVKRTLALMARGVRRGDVSEATAMRAADEMIATGARFPFGPGAFARWAREQGLLGDR